MRPILPRYISTSHPYEDYSRLNVYWLSITESVFSTAIIVLISCDAKFVLVTSQRGPEKPRHTDDSSSRLTQQNLTFISRGLHDKVSHFFGSERTSTMFGKSSFIVIVFILLSSTFAKGKPKTSDFTKSPALTVHKKPQPIDQTFNINNWGLEKADRKLLTEMKYEIDYLYQKSTSAP